MIYRVLVKRPTRKGGEVVVDRVIGFDGEQWELNNLMVKSYSGLLVECIPVDSVEKIENVVTKPAPITENKVALKTLSRIKINLRLNDEEIAMNVKAEEKRREYVDCVNKLNCTVTKRYEEMMSVFGCIREADAFRKHGDYSNRTAELVLDNKIEEFTSKLEELKGIENVGKLRESKTIEFEVPEMLDTWSPEGVKRLNAMADKACPEGWRPDYYFGSQSSFFHREDKYFARCTIRRWVEK